MKTTIELPDDLAREIKAVAASEGTTMRSIVEESLRRELQRRQARPAWKPDPSLAYGHGGFTPQAQAMTWSQLRELAYER